MDNSRERFEMELWANAWIAVASKERKISPEKITEHADICLKDFRKRFPVREG